MASPPIPPALHHLAIRRFSFYPPIVNVEHNEWQFRKATWSDIQVVNCRSGEEVRIPRRYVGEVSIIDDPVLIVGLYRELELKGGMVVPLQRRIIEMPVAVNAAPVVMGPTALRHEPAPVIGIRLEQKDRRVFKLVLIAVAGLAAIYLVVVSLARLGDLLQKKSAAHPPRERFEADALPLPNWSRRTL